MRNDLSRWTLVVVLAVGMVFFAACGAAGQRTVEKNVVGPLEPSRSLTSADIAKLKWLEGTWRGMDGDKPFYERYRFEGDTMIVEGLADEKLDKVTETSRYELKDGEFGTGDDKARSAASEITADSVTFVPVARSGNSYKFQKQPDGSWKAILTLPATPNKPAGEKIYHMKAVGK